MQHKPVVVAFGFKARTGKGECVEYLARAYKGSRPLVTSFAKALRAEIHLEMHRISKGERVSCRDALQLLCEDVGVRYDPWAPSDHKYPHGKQRELLQWWGMDRRSKNPFHWVEKVEEEVTQKKPKLVLIDDLRFRDTEACWVKNRDGVTVRVDRPDFSGISGAAGSHVSEHDLAHYAFDHTIVNDGSLKQLQGKAADLYRQILQQPLFT